MLDLWKRKDYLSLFFHIYVCSNTILGGGSVRLMYVNSNVIKFSGSVEIAFNSHCVKSV